MAAPRLFGTPDARMGVQPLIAKQQAILGMLTLRQ